MKIFLPLVLVVCCAPAWAQNPLSVHVLDESGKPIAGALVEARVFTRDEAKIAPLTTDATGGAIFSIPNGDEGKTAPAAFTAGAAGYSFANALSADGKEVEIRLVHGKTWRGKVVDDKGAPLAGARVFVRGAIKGREFSDFIFLSEDALLELYSAQSKADGTFEIPNLPDDKELLYGVTRPMFVKVQGQDAKVGTDELVKMQPGGALKGRALDVAGQPLAKMTVYASGTRGMDGNWAETDADGTFTIEGLASGVYSLGATEPNNATFVMPRLENVRVEVGKTATAGEWRAQKAIEIRGLVRDSATKKPLTDASFAAQDSTDRDRNSDSAWATSDPNGRFVLRVLPGQYTVTSRGAPSGFLRSDEIKTVETKASAAPEITFELKSAPVVRGVTLDENGKPIAAKLLIGNNGFGQQTTSDANGKWEYAPSNNNDLTFGGGDDDEGYFEVISPKRVDFPAKGPITVTVRRKPWQSLAGRVVTPDGTPVEGAKIEAEFTVQTSDSDGYGAKVSATSDKDGRYVLEKLRDSRQRDVGRTEVEVSAEKAGFQFKSGGEVTREGDEPRVSDLVFVPLSSQIRGTTQAGATVVVAGRETRADAEGNFSFEALPAGENTVYAAKDDLFGSASTAQTPLKISLQRPDAPITDETFARELWAQAKTGDSTLDLDDWRAQTDFAANLTRAQKSGKDWKIAEALHQWKRGDSLEVLRAALEKMPPSEQRTASFLEAAIQTDDADLTERALQIADAQFETETTDVLWREPQLYQAAVLIERRDGAQAGVFALRTALAYTLKNHPVKSRIEGAMQTAVGRNEAFMNAASIVAAGSPALLRETLESIESGSGFEVRARAEAIPVVARAHGYEAAKPWLEELQTMPAPTLDMETRYTSFDTDWALGQAVHDAMPFIGQADPAAALQWARKVQGDDQRARALASAARFQTPEVAAQVLREAIEKSDSEIAPTLAAYAYERDEKLGLELFEIARQKADDDMKNKQYNWRNAWIPFAFYYARVNPAQSRLILEREWAKSREAKADADAVANIALAMTPADARRAAQMATEIGGNDGWGGDARIKIARYLFADAQTRDGFRLNSASGREAWDGGALQW